MTGSTSILWASEKTFPAKRESCVHMCETSRVRDLTFTGKASRPILRQWSPSSFQTEQKISLASQTKAYLLWSMMTSPYESTLLAGLPMIWNDSNMSRSIIFIIRYKKWSRLHPFFSSPFFKYLLTISKQDRRGLMGNSSRVNWHDNEFSFLFYILMLCVPNQVISSTQLNFTFRLAITHWLIILPEMRDILCSYSASFCFVHCSLCIVQSVIVSACDNHVQTMFLFVVLDNFFPYITALRNMTKFSNFNFKPSKHSKIFKE